MPLWLDGEESLETIVFVSPYAEKFNKVNKVHGRTRKCIFSFLQRNTLFGQIWFKKIKIVSLRSNLVSRPIRIGRIQGWCSLFLISTGDTVLWQISWLIRVCKIKCWTSLFLFLLDVYPLWVNFVQKIKVVVLNWNLLPLLIWICRIQWWSSFFSAFDLKYYFLANMVQKIQIVSLSWNLVTKLILAIQWWCSLFVF